MAAEKLSQNSDSYLKNAKKSSFDLVNSLLKNITNPRDKILVKLIAQTGISIEELTNLRITDFDFHTHSIKTQKTVKLLPEELARELYELSKESCGYLFSSKKSPRLRPRSIRKLFSVCSKKLGQKVSPKDLKFSARNDFIADSSLIESKTDIGLKRFDNKKFLTEDNIKKIVEFSNNPRDSLIIRFMYETGCMSSEILSFRSSGIFSRSVNFPTRPARFRTVSVSHDLIISLQDYCRSESIGPSELVFRNKKRALSDKSLYQIISTNSLKAGLSGVSPKVMRYSCVARLIRQKVPFADIERITGVKNLSKFHLFGSLVVKNVR